jgi:hypothetical protein
MTQRNTIRIGTSVRARHLCRGDPRANLPGGSRRQDYPYLIFTLQTFPEGMSASGQGELRWDVPHGETAKRVPVIGDVSNRAGRSAAHSFEIEVE